MSHEAETGVYPMADPVVVKEYQEDLGEKAADGSYDYEYRYWVYWIVLDGRRYRARIYTDTAHDADVMHLDGPHPPSTKMTYGRSATTCAKTRACRRSLRSGRAARSNQSSASSSVLPWASVREWH
jgi:hypothetical protein